ncbi:MAG TPA: hypothetical protein VND99_02875 [Candidatus Acidoferrales bacterium]|nr:hypothetical protein [Candidatus Acidoferrales bacterium]
MLFFTLFFIELFLLFLLSRSLTRNLSLFLYRISKSKHITISAIAILFLPGTFIHELAHALFAGILGVRVGTMEFMPRIDGEHVKLGSVQIAQTDPIRRFLIGAAPFFFGTAILLGLLFYFVHAQLYNNYLFVLLVGYAVFEIGNTMFSSRKDMEGALELFAAMICIVIILYLLGVRLPTFNPNSIFGQKIVLEVFQRGSIFLLVPLTLDTIIILLFKQIQKR